MKFTVMITLVMIALVGFTGIVSAELGLLYYDYSDLTGIESSDHPVSRYSDGRYNARWFEVKSIENFANVKHIVVGIHQKIRVYDSKSGLTTWECPFTAKIYGGSIIGTGTYYCTQTSSTHATLTYVFDDYDIGDRTGNCWIDFELDESDAYILPEPMYGGTLTDTELGHFNLRWAMNSYHVYNDCVVYQETDFHQSLGYNYDYDLNTMGLKFKRNFNRNNVLITDQDGNIRIDNTDSADLELFYADVIYLWVNVTNPYTDYVWTNVLPLKVQYDVIKEPTNPVLGNVTPSEIDINAYRASIIALPLIGNMSEPYLDFVDDMYTDAFAMAKSVIDTLMYPVDLVNYNMITVTDILQRNIDDINDRFGILTAPMTKIIVAIPEKVMGFFVFALGLDIIKIILAWRV